MITTDKDDNTVSVFRGTAFLGASYTGKADGVWYFHVRAVNSAGVGGPTTTRELRIDRTAPATSDSSYPALAADGDSSWRQTGQTVTLAAADESSDLAHIYYTLDGVQHEYEGAFDVSGDGSHEITYWSTDVAGNIEAAHHGWVNIDGDAPSSSDASTPALALDSVSGWHNAAQLVTLSAADAGAGAVSGVARIEYDLDGAGYVPYVAPFLVGTQASHTLSYRAVDRAGNVEAAHDAFVNLDLTAPSISSSADGDAAWHNADVDVTLTSGDEGGSGLAGVQQRRAGETEWTGVTGGSFTVPATGETGPVTYEYRAVDGAGNETTGGFTLKFDGIAPDTIDASEPALAADGDSGWTRTGQTVSFSAGDAGGSGLAATFYTLDGEQHDYTGPFAVSGDGSHEITWWSTDAAGNEEAAHTGYVNVWGTAPQTSANAVVTAAADEGWSTSAPQPVSLTATGGHGAVTVHYVLDGGPQVDVAGAASFDVSGDGRHTLEYWATDALGNEESHHTGHVDIDTTAPETTDDYAGGDAWQTGPVSFSLTADDATSGVDGTSWSVDGGAAHSGADVLVTGDGEHTVTYASTDLAGNPETPHDVTVKIDAGAPVTGDDAPAGWRKSDTTVTLSPVDAFSGMTGGLATTTWELDGATGAGTSVLVAAPSDHSGDGARKITYRSTDAVGNARRTARRRSWSTRSLPSLATTWPRAHPRTPTP